MLINLTAGNGNTFIFHFFAFLNLFAVRTLIGSVTYNRINCIIGKCPCSVEEEGMKETLLKETGDSGKNKRSKKETPGTN